MKMESDCCGAEVIERSYPSLALSRDIYICTLCGSKCRPQKAPGKEKADH